MTRSTGQVRIKNENTAPQAGVAFSDRAGLPFCRRAAGGRDASYPNEGRLRSNMFHLPVLGNGDGAISTTLDDVDARCRGDDRARSHRTPEADASRRDGMQAKLRSFSVSLHARAPMCWRGLGPTDR